MGDPQATDEVSETGLQLADDVLQAEPEATIELKPRGLQATTKLEPEAVQATTEPGGLKVSQGVGWAGSDPRADVPFLSRRLSGGDPASACHTGVMVEESLGTSEKSLRGPTSALPPTPLWREKLWSGSLEPPWD